MSCGVFYLWTHLKIVESWKIEWNVSAWWKGCIHVHVRILPKKRIVFRSVSWFPLVFISCWDKLEGILSRIAIVLCWFRLFGIQVFKLIVISCTRRYTFIMTEPVPKSRVPWRTLLETEKNVLHESRSKSIKWKGSWSFSSFH